MLYLKTLTDEHSKEIYSQARILFNLREETFKKLSTKGIIKNDSDQSGIEYEENIAERTRLRKQRLREIKRKEQNINNDSFKKYFKYQSPSNMYKELDEIENTEKNQIRLNLIKSSLSDLKKEIGNTSEDDINKIQEMNKTADVVGLTLEFNNNDDQ